MTVPQLRARLDVDMGGMAAVEVMLGPEKKMSGASGDLRVRIALFAEVCGVKSLFN